MKQVILGTAGHIDHGKTSLIRAMTGIDTDRLKEEKERGITIELGFAHMDLPSGQVLGIVDVPGHEKFVKNMVAGASGIDLVALIIAADEGVMPQTREHLEICELLDVQHGLVVLTKTDMVDEEWLDMVQEDTTEFLEGTFLENAPMVPVSSATGEGIEELIQVLDDLVQKVPERDPGSFFRLPVDRVFVMKGFGTVITGTTVSGAVRIGDEVTVYPQEIDSKVRGLQVHNREVEEARRGQRTAVNLQGVEKAQIQRGNVIAGRRALRNTYMLDVLVDLLPAAPRKMKNRAKVRFHTGTAEVLATVVLLDRDELKPGESCYAQLRLDQPIAVLMQDRFVLRSYSPVRAIGGGKVLNALPRKKKRHSRRVLEELEVFNSGDLSRITEQFVALGRFQGVEHKDLPFLTNSRESQLKEILQKLLSRQRILMYDRERRTYIHRDFYDLARKEILDTLEAYHRNNPLKAGLSKEELRSRSEGARNPKLFNYMIGHLVQEDLVAREQEVLHLTEHKVTLGQDQEKVRGEIEAAYREGGLQPPYFKELVDRFPERTARDVLHLMTQEGVLVKVKEDLYFHREAVEELRKRLIEFLKEHGEITTPRFKEMTGASRKYAIPLIEHFDLNQVTVRVGDNRVLRKQ
ncbi:MAG: selenocysteine-specific translation elongation factor [Deltaproteobacteria bacterium]|nr:selenocysteine-specific translation elongation factor [Deltaproteobacteria bacterium]